MLQDGLVGETYNIGGWSEKTNLDVVQTLCDILDELKPVSSEGPVTGGKKPLSTYRSLITFVKDRPGHDRRYAIDTRKIERELGWKPLETFTSGLHKTATWYLQNQRWVANVASGSYRTWINQQYGIGV